jgi:putative ABC transport system permease protein
MFKNYLKTTFRFLLKNRTFTLINIIGLAMGTLCCLYIVFYVVDQHSYDKQYNDAKDIYRVTSSITMAGVQENMATASPPIAPAMKNDFSQVKEYTRLVNTIGAKEHLLRYKDKSFYENDMAFVDSTFFKVFTYHFVAGSAKSALMAPYSVVLMAPVAKKLFGRNGDPVGKLIQIDDRYGDHDYKVTGIVDGSLGKSSIKANMFVSMSSGGFGRFVLENNTWSGSNFTYTFVKLYPDASAATLDKKLPAFLKKYGQQQLQELGMKKELHLQPVGSIHTTPGYEVEMSRTVSPAFLRLLLLIAGLIQLIACINFMNLSTARASKRAKEVGVRKVVGAGRKDLVKQFLCESIVLSVVGVAVALPLLLLLLPYLNRITGADVGLSLLGDYRLWLSLGGLVIMTSLVAGSYPTFYLSAFRAIKVMKGNLTNHLSAVALRRALVVFQFALSIILITGIVIIYSQMDFIQHKDLGFKKDQKLIFTFYTPDALNGAPAFIHSLKQLTGVKAVSRANNYPSQLVFNDNSLYPPGGNKNTAQDIHYMLTDEHFIRTLGITMLSGRDFRLQDSAMAIINETAVKGLGLNPETAVGTMLYSPHGPGIQYKIIGVMKDFNYNSLRDQVSAFMLVYDKNGNDLPQVIVSTGTGDYKTLLTHIKNIWQNDFPAVPFTYSFLDDDIQKQYKTEVTMSHIINSFTLLAILISCLGLFGLAAFSAEQRTKEIGIRKTLGASMPHIVRLLSKDFLMLVLLAIVIAVPVSWWAMNKWLRHFAYRVAVSWWMFALAGLLAVLIALITVSSQAVRAASANPVKSLRSE